MDITSIDNCYEDDGLVNLTGALNALNHQLEAEPRRQLVAILPEFREDGRLDRLNVCTVPAEDPGALSDDEMALLSAAAGIVAKLQRDRAAAMAQIAEPQAVRDAG